MQQFSYSRAPDIAAALQQSKDHGESKYLGGGTTLLDCMKLHVETPAHLVDVNHLANRIEVKSTTIRIGAAVRNSDLAYHEVIRTKFPVLSEALLAGATPQIRNMATVAGNLLQRTRCTYFRDTTWPCNKREPDSGCSAIDGFNRSHAILGTSDKCIATHPSDMCVALIALDAVIEAEGPRGKRQIPMRDFHVAYGEDPIKESVLEAGELITAVEIPELPFYARSHYLKVRDRASFEFALVSVAAALQIEGDRITGARLALGGVGTKPWRATEAEQALVGRHPDENAFVEAAGVALRDARPQRDNGFKIELAKRSICRALGVVARMK
ncbi:MAG: molybdopterin dehydrogenase, FAD-binding [Planctomycetaceae bacterium]|nr:molybdopterin dehydrogenase, FAD-binding [Planctomycetaceae bacterium]